MKFEKLFILFLCSLSIWLPTSVEAVLAGANPSSVAGPQDAFAGATNPAGIVLVGDRLDISYRLLDDHKFVEIVDNTIPTANGHYDVAAQQKKFHFGEFAINKVFKKEICCHTWEYALNFAFYTPFYNRCSWKNAIVLAGTTPINYEQWEPVFAPMIALKINDHHSIGISLDTYMYIPKINGLENFDNPTLTVAPGFVTNKGRATTWAVTCTLGWRWQITKSLAFGFAFSPQVPFRKIHKYQGFYAKRGGVDTLNDVRAGFLYVCNPKFAIFFDVEWLNFKKTLVGNRLLDSQGNFNILGSKDGAENGYRNQFIFLIGAGYRPFESLSLRASYIHLTQKVPRSQTFFNSAVCSIVENILSAGGTYHFLKNWELSFLYAHGFEAKINGKNSIPFNVGGGNSNLSQNFNIASIGLGYKY